MWFDVDAAAVTIFVAIVFAIFATGAAAGYSLAALLF